MRYSFKARVMSNMFHNACKKQCKKRGISNTAIAKIMPEHKQIVLRAKDMNDGRLFSSYMMGIYFIAMNRGTGLSAEENYNILSTALSESLIFRKGLGTAEKYLDEKNIPMRLKWSEESHKRKNENNWVVDILTRCNDFDLGYNYTECGICKICRDEGCFELAKYLCRLDFMIADLMNVKLVRTKTLANGDEMCDFRYSMK